MIAHWTAEKAKGSADGSVRGPVMVRSTGRLAYWTGVKAAGRRKAKAYDRALVVLKKNLEGQTAAP